MTTPETIRAAKRLIEDHTAAKKCAPRPLRVLWELDSVLHQGRMYLHAWEEIERTTREPDGEILATAFLHFCVSGAALLIASSLDATKLLETQSDSVHVQYFLNLVENEGKPILNENWPETQCQIPTDRRTLEALRVRSEDLRDLRDERLAHLDRNVLSGSLSDRAAADAKLLRIVFDGVTDILRHYVALRYGFQYTPPAEFAITFPWLNGGEPACIEETFGPENLRDLLDIARLGWNTLPELDPVVSRSRGLHERLWRISRMIHEHDESNSPVGGDA